MSTPLLTLADFPWGERLAKADPVRGAEAIERARLEDQRQLAAERRRARMAAAQIPQRYTGATMEPADWMHPRHAREAGLAARYVQALSTTRRWLVFVGPPGTGKTHMAAAILQAAIRHGLSGLFTTALAAVTRVRSSWTDRTVTEAEAYASLSRPDLLVLDEVGAHPLDPRSQSILFEVLNARYQAGRPLVICTNLESREALGQALGEPIESRLRECAEVRAYDWADLRGAQR